MDLLPLDKAFAMVTATKQATVLRHTLLAARTLGRAIDVVRAAAATADAPRVDRRKRSLLQGCALSVCICS
jgi:hypothetical protein